MFIDGKFVEKLGKRIHEMKWVGEKFLLLIVYQAMIPSSGKRGNDNIRPPLKKQ